MANATPFPDPWGYEEIIGNNSTNIVDAAIATWRNSGEGQIAMDFTWGFIPIMLMAVAFIRFKRIDIMMFTGLISTYAVSVFGLMTQDTSYIMYTLVVLGSGLSLAYKLYNKN